jgi:hypothetical protein
MEKSDESTTGRDEQRRKYSKMDKRAIFFLMRPPPARSTQPGTLLPYTTSIRSKEKKGKTQEKMERGSRKRSSSAGSEKMERVGGR